MLWHHTSITGRNISFIYVWMLSQPCVNTQFQLLSAAVQLPSEIAKNLIHVWILFTQLNLTIQLSYAWHRLFMQLILRRVNGFSACCAISCNLSVTPLPPIMLWSHKDVYNLERGRRGGVAVPNFRQFLLQFPLFRLLFALFPSFRNWKNKMSFLTNSYLFAIGLNRHTTNPLINVK